MQSSAGEGFWRSAKRQPSPGMDSAGLHILDTVIPAFAVPQPASPLVTRLGGQQYGLESRVRARAGGLLAARSVCRHFHSIVDWSDQLPSDPHGSRAARPQRVSKPAGYVCCWPPSGRFPPPNLMALLLQSCKDAWQVEARPQGDGGEWKDI